MGAEVNAAQAIILQNLGITVEERKDGTYYVDKTVDELSVLLSRTGYISGDKPVTLGVTTVNLSDNFLTGPTANILFDYNAIDGEHGLTQNSANLNTSTTTSTTVDLSKYGQSFVAQLQQQGLIKAANFDYTQCEIADGKMEEVAKQMAKLDSLPDKMDEVEFGGDQSVQNRIKQELLDAGIIDEQGNIIDKTKFGELFDLEKGTITIAGETYKFDKEEDGTQDVQFTQTTTTTVSSKFKELSPEWLENQKRRFPEHWKAQLEDLEKKGFVAIVDGRYFTTVPRMQKPDTVDATESNGELDVKKLVGNKAEQDKRETQLQEEFLELYDANPANAQDTLLHTKYYKSYKALEDALIKMNSDDMSDVKSKDYGNEVAYRRKGTLARSYFAQSRNMNGETVYEFATPEDISKLQEKVTKHLADLKKLTNIEQIDEYKTFFGDVLDSNIDELSDDQLQQLAEAKAYNEGLTDAQIKHMASTQFQNRFNTEMNKVYSEFQDKIAQAKAKGDTKKVQKLQRQLDEKLQEIRNRQTRTENEDRGDYAAMMARGQLNSEIGQGNFEKTRENLTYESVISTCPEAKEFIEKNKTLFFTDGKFDADKWQQFWLRKSSSREDNNTAEDNEPIKDYFMSLGEAQGILRGNPNGKSGEAYVGLESLYGDKSENALINIARKMAETAGISTEANNTAGLRTAYVFKEMGKGAAAGLAADVLGNFVMSKIHIPYAGKVVGTVTGTVTGTVSGTVNFARSGVIQDLDHFVSNTYENGRLVDQQITDVLEEHPWHVEGSEDYTKEFSKDYSKDYSQNYSGSKKLRGFTIDPWAVGLGAAGGLVKGLIGKNKIHDKEDKNSRVQQYSRRDYNERPEVNPTMSTTTVSTPKFKYTATVKQATPPVDIENDDYKITYSPLKSDSKGNYRLFQDKKAVVARYYGLTGNEPYFNNLYKFVMEQTNGLKQGQYNQAQYVNGTTYHFPQTILADQIEGLDNDLGFDENADLSSIPQTVKIYYTTGGRYSLHNKNNKTQRPGSNAEGTVTARRK